MPRGVHIPSGQPVIVHGYRSNWGEDEFLIEFPNGLRTHWRTNAVDVCPCSYAQKHDYVRGRWANGCDIEWSLTWHCKWCGRGHWFPHEFCGCGWEAQRTAMRGI